jgi:D-sedoheptulose 7-phosphate isomerase
MNKNFLKEISQIINDIDNNKIKSATKIILKKKKNNKIILAGNGASATISSHVAVDLTKSAKIRAVNFNEAGLLTCFSNDYGYENWLKKALEFYSIPGDIVILISSSGNSKNIINAAKISKKLNLQLITLSGFSKNNKLRNKGIINFHINSNNYNIVESAHLLILLQIVENILNQFTRKDFK